MFSLFLLQFHEGFKFNVSLLYGLTFFQMICMHTRGHQSKCYCTNYRGQVYDGSVSSVRFEVVETRCQLRPRHLLTQVSSDCKIARKTRAVRIVKS